MNSEMIKSVDMDNKVYDRIEKTVEKNGVRKTICAEEVENGWVVSVTKEGEEKGEYKYDCKKYISKKNPFEPNEEPDEDKKFDRLLASISENMGY